MPTVDEAISGGQYAASLKAGIATISQNQEITFTRYQRIILPLDGFAFWVRADLLAPTPLVNSLSTLPPTAFSQAVMGSLHYSTTNTQDENEGFAVNRVIFTSEVEVEALTTDTPVSLAIGEFDGQLFAFSRRNMLYRQSGLYHYQGDAVYPTMATQIISDLSQLADRSLIVSNSLPIWLTLNQYCPMVPSYLVPDNITPPYCAVHVEPSRTTALQAVPYLDSTGSHYQLATDLVRLTFYGLNNNAALDFQDYVNTYSLNTDNIGIMGMPIFRDEKRTQAELNILAQKKTIEYEVSYYQQRVRAVAQKFILSAFVNVLTNPMPTPTGGSGSLDFSIDGNPLMGH